MKYLRYYATQTEYDNDASVRTSLLSSVTTAEPSCAITSFIASTGKSITQGMNIFVEKEALGLGDYLLYDTSKSDYLGISIRFAEPASFLSLPTVKLNDIAVSALPSNYKVVGICGTRRGNKIPIVGTGAAKPWDNSLSTDTTFTAVPNLTSFTSIYKANGEVSGDFNPYAYVGFYDKKRWEINYGSTANSTYGYISRTQWNTAVASGATTVTATNSKTVTLADYGNSYDRWFDKTIKVMFPASAGATSDTNGRANTALIISYLNSIGGLTLTNYAAGYCDAYAIASVPEFGAHAWYLGSYTEMMDIAAHGYMFGSPTYIWSSTQHSERYAWPLYSDGYSYYDNKYYGFTALPLSALYL